MLSRAHRDETIGIQGQDRGEIPVDDGMQVGSDAIGAKATFVISGRRKPRGSEMELHNVESVTQIEQWATPESILIMPPVPPPEQRFVLLQQWEGIIVALSDTDFVAVTRDLTNPTLSEERVVFPFDEVSPPDRSLVAPGSVFYWSIGYEVTRSGTMKTVSMLRFRRLPAWTQREISEARRKAQRWLSVFET